MSTMAYITYTTCRYNRDRMQNKWFLIQLSKKKRNKIKIRVLPFSKSYPKIESTWPTAKCRGRKSFDTWYYIVTCATLCVRSLPKLNRINVFPKYILKSKARDQLIQARKNFFCHVIVKDSLCNVLWQFMGKVESTWKSKSRRSSWFYCTMAQLSEAVTGGVF